MSKMGKGWKLRWTKVGFHWPHVDTAPPGEEDLHCGAASLLGVEEVYEPTQSALVVDISVVELV